MPQAKTVVPQLINVIGIALILMWVGFIALLAINGQFQFTAIMVAVSALAILIIARNDI
jgi:hypothetical protein